MVCGQLTETRKGFSLDTCKVLAIENNYRIREASNEVLQSEQLKKNTFTNFFPKVSAGFSAVKMSDYMLKGSLPGFNLPVYDGNPVNLPAATQFAYFPGMEISLLDYLNFGYAVAVQPLFTGGRIYNGNRLARTGYEISLEKRAAANTEVLVRTEELYWNLMALNEKLLTIDSYRKLLDNLNRDVSAAFEAGLVQRTDLLKVRLKQNELEGNRLRLTNGIELSRRALCQHIGIQYDSAMVLKDSTTVTGNPVSLFVDPEEAVKNRNEYRMLQKAVYAEKLQKKIVEGEYLPQLSAGVAGVYTDMMDKTNELGIAFVTLSVPISDWWGGSYRIRQSRAKLENAGNRLDESSELLSLQITQLQNELTNSYFTITIAEKSLEQAGENLKVVKDNYDAGVTGMSDLLEAQSVYEESRNNLTEARCNYLIGRAKYLQSINNYE